jgi:isopentenyl-diphosphate delta-isomerase
MRPKHAKSARIRRVPDDRLRDGISLPSGYRFATACCRSGTPAGRSYRWRVTAGARPESMGNLVRANGSIPVASFPASCHHDDSPRLEQGTEMEHVILLDESGNAAGRQDKSSVHTSSTPLHLAFSCYVFNSAGDFLASRRALGKLTWPGIWTNSVCGHPAEGEKMTDAVRRRASFELGLALGEVRLVLPAFRYRAELDGVVENEMCPVFYAEAAGEPAPNPEEVASTRWLTWADFQAEALAEGSVFSPWCRLQIRELASLGPIPGEWPAGDPAAMPPAAIR